MPESKPTTLSLKPVVSAGFEIKVVCSDVKIGDRAVKLYEGEALHDCMRKVSGCAFVPVSKDESHPRLDLVLEVVGESSMFAQGKTYKLRIEPDV